MTAVPIFLAGGADAEDSTMSTLLWVLAVTLVVVGVVQLLQGQIVFGLILLVVGLVLGPGGFSVHGRR